MSDKKIAVLVSGGLDSFLAYRLACYQHRAENVAAVFVRYGQPYQAKEESAVRALIPEAIFVDADLVADKLDNVPTLHQQEIYGRNILLAFYGAQLAPEVWLAALETEMNPTAVRDKQPEFLHMLSMLFTYTFKSKRFETRVVTPFATKTKSDIVADALLKEYATKEEILRTSTCYHEEHKACGECSTCFKRWIALTNNELTEEYATDITKNEYGRTTVGMMEKECETNTYSGRFSPQRIQETRWAIEDGLDVTMEDFARGR
jgi:7-cyano-7-deazaguanine synthase